MRLVERGRRHGLWFLCGMVGLMVGGACSGEDEASKRAAALAEPGPWLIPDDVMAAGDEQFVEFTSGGPWVGEEGCGGGLLEGTGILREYLFTYYPQAHEIGGYACRPIVGDPANMSVHATGRALDIMIHPVDGGEADNEMGDPIANWFVANAEYIGVQQIIWDRLVWRAQDAPGEKARPYTGEHPHHDHVHVELSVEAAGLGTPFFQEEQGPPDMPSCGTVAPEGGVIDDLDSCADFYGPPEYWRAVDGEGEGGSLLWTDAFESPEPSNWARWNLDFASGGTYRVEYHAVADYALAPRVRYEIRHGTENEVVWIDQSAQSGWVALGDFDFAAGSGQSVAVFDNVDQPVAEGQHIVFDALRVTPCSGGECLGGDPGPDGDPDGEDQGSGDPGSGDPEDPSSGAGSGPDDDTGSASNLAGGCSAASGSTGATWLVVLFGAALVRFRPRRQSRRAAQRMAWRTSRR
jgi:MYXO-CTERM domain-containing protein